MLRPLRASVGVLFTLCKKGAQRRPFLVSTTFPLWDIGCLNLYFLSSKSFVFNITSLNIITDSNLATRNNLYLSLRITDVLTEINHQMLPSSTLIQAFFLSCLPSLYHNAVIFKELIRRTLQSQLCHSKEHASRRGQERVCRLVYVCVSLCLHISFAPHSGRGGGGLTFLQLSWDNQKLSVVPVKPSTHYLPLHHFPSQVLLALFFCLCTALPLIHLRPPLIYAVTEVFCYLLSH